MRTVNEVSKLTGVSVRTLHYYDSIGLLRPTAVTEAGYRLYDDTDLERLQHILLFRELEFPLKEIKRILNSPDFDRNRALEQHIELLTLKKEHLENLILFARGIHGIGVKNIGFGAFDASKLDEYCTQAKAMWGKTEECKEYEKKMEGKTEEEQNEIADRFMQIFVEFGKMREFSEDSREVQEMVKMLQDFITENCYNCTPKILRGLGKMYSGGGSLTENIDEAGGIGTAKFVADAIEVYCSDGY